MGKFRNWLEHVAAGVEDPADDLYAKSFPRYKPQGLVLEDPPEAEGHFGLRQLPSKAEFDANQAHLRQSWERMKNHPAHAEVQAKERMERFKKLRQAPPGPPQDDLTAYRQSQDRLRQVMAGVPKEPFHSPPAYDDYDV